MAPREGNTASGKKLLSASISGVVSPVITRMPQAPFWVPQATSVYRRSPTKAMASRSRPLTASTSSTVSAAGLPRERGTNPVLVVMAWQMAPQSGIGSASVGQLISGWVARKRAPRRQVDAGLFQPFVGQCFIKAHHNKIRLFFGKGNSGFRKTLPQGGYPQKINTLPCAVCLQVVNGHIAGRENVLPGDRNAHAGKALHIFQRAAAGVIGEKQHPPAFFFCRGDKLSGTGQQPVAQIYGAIQVQHKQPDALQQGFILLHFGSSHRSIGRNFLINIAHLPRPVHQSPDYGTGGLL